MATERFSTSASAGDEPKSERRREEERSGPAGVVASAATAPSAQSFFVATHEVLFEQGEGSVCDACGAPLSDADASTDLVGVGRGAYLRVSGGETRIEHVPLCAECASAIGVTALARWEIEEEEG